MKLALTITLSLVLGGKMLLSQVNPNFNVQLAIDYTSAEKAVELYGGLSGRGSEVASLHGSQIALATTSLLEGRYLSTAQLEQSLDDAKFGVIQEDDVFEMKDAREHAEEIRTLLLAMQKRNFGQRVVRTVEQLFPTDAKVSATIPMYVVAFGHHNIDAYVRRVVWQGDVPVFVGEGQGELTIVVNLAKAVHYGPAVDEQFIGTLSVVAHEVFHAVFGVYKDASPIWSSYYATHRSYLDRLLDLTQNEGIAHYLSFEQRMGDALPRDWDRHIDEAFRKFNLNADRLAAPNIAPGRADAIIRQSNTSGFWESYGAITGLFIARQIDRALGREALAETVAHGPDAFFSKYMELARQDNGLPSLSTLIQQRIAD